jgi:hypothetical protein
MSTNMRGLTIADKDDRNILRFDLKDILRLVGEKGLESVWTLHGIESVNGEVADEMHRLSDTGIAISGARLKFLADRILQVIDGEFRGASDTASEPWVSIRAIDSSAFDVLTNDEDVLQRFEVNFEEVTEIPRA